MDRLVELIRSKLSHLEPIPTSMTPRLPELSNLRMIAFDVYGTLVTSFAGEIGVTERSTSSFIATTRRLGLSENLADSVEERFHEIIEAIHEQKRSTICPYPEVEIRDVWRSVAQRFLDRQVIRELERIPLFWDRIAIEHEIDTNPVWPMPGAGETIASAQEAGVSCAIVSNAQFYTPLMIQALFGSAPSDLGFSPTIWSYQIGVAKPSPQIFSRLLDTIAPVAAENVLYVGNDMRNDIAPAATLGMRTALFAGDNRSLRLRENDTTVEGIAPDVVLTDLRQLIPLIHPKSNGS